MNERMHLLIRGLVQGVCFRMHTRAQAEALDLSGWVRNLPSGQVELVAEGPRAALEALREWCRDGPDHARVTEVTESFSPAEGEFRGFTITR